MARILFAWELGEGLGHLVKVAPVLRELARRGHTVLAALRDVTRARLLFPDREVALLPAPSKLAPAGDEVAQSVSFAHVLHNTGFGSPAALGSLAEAWRNLFLAARPDAILFDHSPSAVLASRGLFAARVVVGTGFVCPPDAHPLPSIRPWAKSDPEALARAEDAALANANVVLRGLGLAPLAHLSRLYAEVDDTLLLTFRELDHYPDRPGAHYWGTATSAGGAAPVWQPGDRKRVFAYLKPTPKLPAVLAGIGRLGVDLLAYVPGLRPDVRARLGAANVRFADGPVDMAATAATCDLAVLNGTHGSTAGMLLAGKPTLHLPIHVEQALLAFRVQALGAGRGVSRAKPEAAVLAVRQLLGDARFAAAAGRIAAKYHGFREDQQAAFLADRIEGLVRKP